MWSLFKLSFEHKKRKSPNNFKCSPRIWLGSQRQISTPKLISISARSQPGSSCSNAPPQIWPGSKLQKSPPKLFINTSTRAQTGSSSAKASPRTWPGIKPQISTPKILAIRSQPTSRSSNIPPQIWPGSKYQISLPKLIPNTTARPQTPSSHSSSSPRSWPGSGQPPPTPPNHPLIAPKPPPKDQGTQISPASPCVCPHRVATKAYINGYIVPMSKFNAMKEPEPRQGTVVRRDVEWGSARTARPHAGGFI